MENHFEDKESFYVNNTFENVCVKGRLRENLQYWESELEANCVITSIIKEGYKIPFTYTPKKAYFKNNKSALKNEGFVSNSIKELLENNLIKEVATVPHVVNPLSVAENSVGKKRLILDLRYVNKHIYTEKIKFDDWKCFQNFLTAKSKFLFKFDLKSGYHHVDINENFQKFLGFSWLVDGKIKHFVFTVLPFGLSSAPFIFTKLVRPLVKYWRKNLIRIACFLDDGISVAESLIEGIQNSNFVRETLQKAGFVVNIEKSAWEPQESITWLGITIDLKIKSFCISNSRIESITYSLTKLTSTPYVTARNVAKVVGKIISTIFVLGNIVRLKTRFLYKSIIAQNTWDSHFNILYFHDAVKEIIFWKLNVNLLNKRSLISYKVPITKVYSDASNSGIGTCFTLKGEKFLIHRNLSTEEKIKSSTWRELEAIRFSLTSIPSYLSNNTLFWYTDNFAASKIVESGSNKSELQVKALEIFDICKTKNIDLKINWISRENNKEADCISKIIDHDDWVVNTFFFKFITNKWGKITIDRFASSKNTKSPRFNSKYLCPSTEAVNAFSQDWSEEKNWLVPPIYLIPKCLNHFSVSKPGTTGILIVPVWQSAAFWPLLFSKKGQFINIIKDWLYLPSHALELGDFKGSFIGSEKFNSQLIALYLKT